MLDIELDFRRFGYRLILFEGSDLRTSLVMFGN